MKMKMKMKKERNRRENKEKIEWQLQKKNKNKNKKGRRQRDREYLMEKSRPGLQDLHIRKCSQSFSCLLLQMKCLSKGCNALHSGLGLRLGRGGVSTERSLRRRCREIVTG
ncbi:hypothetical protein MRB53_034489 [Persea americana]|uniref:Uncharacterized protein n=1 Tax=Persea americana TaxID=3435 RepID=A0ACC2K1X2_PERAE|nr:hypothetical protein MRB53_034489 [Persea americana]